MHTDYIGSEERCRFIARKLIYWVAAVAVTGSAVDATGIMDVMRAHAMTTPFLGRSAAAPEKVEGRLDRRADVFIALPAQPAPPRASRTAETVKPNPAVMHAVKMDVAPSDVLHTEVVTTDVAGTDVTGTGAVETASENAVVSPAQAEAILSLPPAEDAEASARSVFMVASATPFVPVDLPEPQGLSRIDPRFEAALTSLALQSGPGEEIPVEPFAGRTKKEKLAALEAAPDAAAEVATVRSEAPVAAPAVVAPAIEAPSVRLPRLAELPLPRPRPPLTPAQELGLDGKERAKAENCLARAIYFEARNEPVRGQIAVAQVVLNRVFSPYYPDTICGVVYQNAHRHLACQFTFACDGIPDIVREKGPWVRAQKIAKQALDAQVWLTDVAKSTHYHATYVRPRWIREMKVMVRHGQHIFYRPHRWGDGREEAGWGVASLTHSVKPKLAKN